MDHVMDPYEQQLLSVFNSYDVTHRGSLNQESLEQLCNSLHLEERGVELVNCLLSDSKTHVTFVEFKDGLLALLGNVQHNRQKLDSDLTDDSDNETQDREISPKFVFGSKKYGRRSRPESTEQIELFEDPEAELEKSPEVKYENKPLKNMNKVQRSNSQSDVTYSRKRKTSGKLKRCTSFPGNHDMKSWNQDKNLKESNIQLSVSEYYNSMLQTAMEQLELGLDGYLNHLEIVRVCEFMGMHKIAKVLMKQLSRKEETDLNRSYTVEEFLEILQTTDDDAFDDSSTISLNSTVNNSCLTDDFGNKPLQYITLGPNGSGMISSQTVVELWENAGIVSATSLLQGLGFSGPNIDIIDLATILDDELRSMNESHNDISYNNINPHIILLQASIVLYQSEVKYLKSLLEQLTAERDKLRTDIADANQRASLLAQEVDDNHAKMEKRTQDQVRFLEQRHADMIKELTSQFLGEKEQLSSVNSQLKSKILTLEAEEARLRSDLQTLQKYNNNLEIENNSLTNKLSDLEFERTSLTEKVGLLENECQKITEIERERDQLEPLLKKLSILQIENAELRDKNDELSTEVESLNVKCKMTVTPTSKPSNAEENVSVICEGVGSGLGAIKRRVDSPCKENINECGLETESPRLGKVRRCYQKDQPEVLLDALGTAVSQLPPFNSSESGFEADLDCLDSSLSFTGSDYAFQVEENIRLRAKVSELEKRLENLIEMPANKNPAGDCINDVQDNLCIQQDVLQYMKRCKQLELLLEGVQASVTDMMKKKSECKDITDILNPMSELSDKLKDIVLENSEESLNNSTVSTSTVVACDITPKNDSYTETDDSYLNMKEIVGIKEKENKLLLDRCEELELALDLLRNEFENCENYWANKLDDERKLSEQDLKQSNDKLAELFIKISEYEQFTANDITDSDGRLSPIEEKGVLEQQFTDLEEEYEDFKYTMELELKQRDQQIASLQLQLNEKALKTVNETSVQVDLTENKINNLSNVIESTNIFSSETLPHIWHYGEDTHNNLDKLNSIDSSVINSNLSNIPERDYINPNLLWSKHNDTVDNDEPFIETVSSTSTTNSISSIKSDMHTCSSLPPNISWQPPSIVPSPQPHSINYIPDHNSHPLLQNSMSCRPKRTRKHDRGIMTMSSRPQKKDQDIFMGKQCNYDLQNGNPRWNSFPLNNGGDQTCVVPLNSIHHLHGRLRELDQHCRHLQYILKQQQRHSESVMHHCWQQNREETNELQMHVKSLQEKLSRADILIKDLYVENTYLMANNQRLEHRCHMLIQCNSESTSV